MLTIHDPDRYPLETLWFAWQHDWQPPTAPVADFTVSATSGVAPLTVTFTDTSSGPPTLRAWDFGDGTAGGGASHMHTYSEPGTYTVSLTVSNAAGTDTETKTGLITVTVANPDPQPDAWDPATMLVSDQLHPNDTGHTYLADCYEWALENAGKTPASGTLLTAYGDSWLVSNYDTAELLGILQLRDRLGLSLTNRGGSGYMAGDCAAHAIGTTGTFAAGTGGLVFVGAGLNDLQQADTAQQRAATLNHLRALFATLCAAERIEQTAFTFTGTWDGGTDRAGTYKSAGSNALTTTEGAAASYNVTTPGTYYLLTHALNSTTFVGGTLTITQGGNTLAVLDLNAATVNTNKLLTDGTGPISVRLDNVEAGTLTVTYSKAGRAGTVSGFIDALVRISDTPPTVLAVKPVQVPAGSHNKPALLDYIRDQYDTLAAEFGTSVVVCDPDPSWTP